MPSHTTAERAKKRTHRPKKVNNLTKLKKMNKRKSK